MKSLTVIFASFLLILASPPCRANLGDTLEKCQARYGPPVPGNDKPDPNGVGDVMLAFQSRGYVVHVVLARGYVAAEFFTKANGAPLSDAEKKLIMQNDAAGWAWAKSTAVGGENWLRTDGAVAAYEPDLRFLGLETARFQAAVAAKQAATAR
jgi:hypothetical protein